MNILGHGPDPGEAESIVRRLMDDLPSGRYLVTADGTNVRRGGPHAVRRPQQDSNLRPRRS
jgi:hypothetical protein